MMIFKKAIPRRTVLQGLGATVALPFLDSMVPAFGSLSAAGKAPLRFTIVKVPNGVIVDKWLPATQGALTLSPTLEPLAPFKDQLLVLSGLSHMIAERRAGETSGPHSRASGGYLTAVHCDRAPEVKAGISLDQQVAREFGKDTQFPSLELAIEPGVTAGSCDGDLSCAYTNSISWRSESTPMPPEYNPRAVFERLFGDNNTTSPAERRARLAEDRSVLDTAVQHVARLAASLGAGDRGKLSEYLDAVRDIERRIQVAEAQSDQELPLLERPGGVPATFEEHAKLMFDLQLLAYQTDMTRVTTFMMGQELSVRTYREIGISEPHHPLSHHANDPDKMAKVARINAFHIRNFGYFLEKLRSTPDGDGTLFDHTVLMYGACLGDGNVHANFELPVLLTGGGAGLRGGRHVRYTEAPPISNLWVSLLELLGTPVNTFGDSTGKVSI